MKNAKLNNGREIPYIGLGVYRMEDTIENENIISYAINEAGYRHIDTAAYYKNEEIVGRAIRKSGVAREDIFVTTKVWNEDQRKSRVKDAFDDSLDKMKLDYVDLYLIHWPVAGKFVESWLVLEEIYKSGRAKAIGISNFKEHHIQTLLESATVKPTTNQIELHPYLNQQDLVEYCQKLDIIVEAWSPLGANKTNLFEESKLKKIALTHKKSVAQIVLRWNYQRNIVTIPKSSNKERLKENLNIFDFELNEEDMRQIYSLDKNLRLGSDPDLFDF